MRRFTAAHIIAIRAVATWTLRVLSVLLLGYGAFLALTRLFFGFATGQASNLTAYYDSGTHEIGALFSGLAMLIVGGVLGGFAKPIAAWAIAVPADACPKCGYPRAAADLRCPECGLDLSSNPPTGS
jgi:hypothetical protein